jgi:hypothetical protein
VELEPTATQVVDVDAIERTLRESLESELPTDEDALQEWLARDEALTADLSFERNKLEDAVAEALTVADTLAPPPEVVPRTIATQVAVPSSLDSSVDIRPPTARQMLLASIAGVIASCGAFFLAVDTGFANAAPAYVLAVIACPILYGIAIVLPGYWLGRLNVLRAILIVLIVPAIAVCSGAVSTITYAVVPGVVGRPLTEQ